MFREYLITGMKVDYRPAYLDEGGTAAVRIYPIQVGTSMDTLDAFPVNPNNFYVSLDKKEYPFNRAFSRFYRVMKYGKGKSLPWRST